MMHTCSRFHQHHLSVAVIVLVALLSSVRNDTLHGTTILNWPYVNRLPNGQFEGFCIDLLNELSPVMGMAYTLQVVQDGEYGGWVARNGSINGMIGEVMRGEVDFAIGDLTVLSTRTRFVEFTQPFLEFGLAALVRRDVLKGTTLRNFKDLSEQTAVRYGVKKYGANLPLFHQSPVVAKMYSFMDTHPSVFVSGEREGVERVKTEKYAFIAESPFVEFVVQRDCELVAIDDRRKHFQFEYAIAVPKGSPLKARFNKALKVLRDRGTLRELKDKYWINPNRRCETTDGATNVENDLIFSGRNRVKDKLSSSDNSVGTNAKDKYRQPHDVVNEEDVEIIKPKEEDSRRRRKKPLRPRPQPSSAQPFVQSSQVISTLVTLLIIVLTIIRVW